MFVKMAVDNLGAHLDAPFHRIADFYLAHVPAIVRLWNSGPRTLVHGDPHIGNLFVDVRDGDRTGFLDWAFLGRSPGLRDVAYVICNSIPGHVRAAATSTAGMASKWQPLHIGLAGTQRATDACQRLQSVELLEELLA